MRKASIGAAVIALLAGILGLAAPAQAALGPVIWLIPHQDDDVLSMGADMKNHVEAGRQNIAVLLTDGSESGVCYQRFGTGGSVGDQRDNGGLSAAGRAACTEIRDAEFTRAMNRLGVDPVIRSDRKQDSCSGTLSNKITSCHSGNTLTEAYVLDVIQEYANQYPNASFKGYTPREARYCGTCHPGGDHFGDGPGHPDHDVIGDALIEAYDQGITDDVRFYVKPSMWGYWPNIGWWEHRGINYVLDSYGDDSPLAPNNGIGHDSSSLFCEQYGQGRAQQVQISNTRNCSNYDYYKLNGSHNYVHIPYP